MKLYDPSTIRMIKSKYGFRFSKSLGQNFLIEPSVPEDIVAASGAGPEDFVLEIGPGIGTLTDVAAREAGHVTAVELDSNLIEILSFTLAGHNNINIVEGDILKQDIPKLIETGKNYVAKGEDREVHTKILGNLPYYITTPIIMKLLESHVPADSITIMIQKEVAERIVSPAGSKVYGALSLAVQYYSEPVWVRDVPKEVFMPSPKVDSAVIRMDLRKEPPVELVSEEMFFACIKSAFGQRRKTLLNSLQGIGVTKPEIHDVLSQAGIDEKRRAETLTMEEFAEIANLFAERNGK